MREQHQQHSISTVVDNNGQLVLPEEAKKLLRPGVRITIVFSPPITRSSNGFSSQEWKRKLRDFSTPIRPDIPALCEEAMSRESIYGDD